MTKKNSKNLLDSSAVETIIGMNSVFEGNLKTDKTVKLDGKFIGNIETSEGLIVGSNGNIEGNITAGIVMICGSVKGNITAPEGIEIIQKAKVAGDIKTNILTIAEGAVFEGKSIMNAGDSDNNGETKK